MKQKIFILVILLSLTCMGAFCYPNGSIKAPPQKDGEGFHREELLLAQSHIPKKVGLIVSGEYLNNPEATEQLKSGLVRLGFNLVEKQKMDEAVGYISPSSFEFPLKITKETKRVMSRKIELEAVLIGYCSIKFIRGTAFPNKLRKDYYVNVMLINFQEENVIWEGSFFGSSIGKSTDQVLKLLQKDIKLFNTKFEGSGPK